MLTNVRAKEKPTNQQQGSSLNKGRKNKKKRGRNVAVSWTASIFTNRFGVLVDMSLRLSAKAFVDKPYSVTLKLVLAAPK